MDEDGKTLDKKFVILEFQIYPNVNQGEVLEYTLSTTPSMQV